MRSISILLLANAAYALAAPGDLPREILLLAHFKQRIRETLARTPNYTCLETVQRYGFEHHGVAFKPLDSIMLEISNVGDKEMLAWPGARKFDEASVADFAAGGMLGSGIFALHARNVFLHDTSIIKWHGDEEIAGRLLARYDFRVPQAWSGYQLRQKGVTATAGTHGSFWIDPDSLDLVRMQVWTDDLPPEMLMESSVTAIDYAPMHIGESDITLPQSAQMVTVAISGDAWRNEIAFGHCHEYRTDTAIRFDMPEETQRAKATPTKTSLFLPAGLTVTIALNTGIGSRTSHVGDPITGRVMEDVRRKGKGPAIVPKGAIATGRIRGLMRISKPEPAIDLAIEIAELEWEDARTGILR